MSPYPDDQEKFDDVTASLSNESDKSITINTGSTTNVSPREQYDLTHMDSAGEYSIGSSQASLQMAQYLDDVESGGNNDICSFQDVNLNEQSPAVFSEEEEVRRARKRYYLLPMLIRYSLPIGGCLLAFVVLLVTIGVTSSVVRSQDEKRMMAMPEIQGDKPQGYDSVGGWDDMLQGDEEVGDWPEYTADGEDGVEEVGDFGVNYDDAPVYDDAPALDDYNSLDDFSSGEKTFDDASSLDDYIVVGDGEDEVGTPIEFTSDYDDASGVDRTYDDAILDDSVDSSAGDEEVGTPIEFSTDYDDASGVDRTYDDAILDDAIDSSGGDEEVGTPIEFTPEIDDMGGADKTDVVDDAIDGSNMQDSGSSSNSGSSSSNQGSMHPKWYSTSNPNYVSLLEFHSSTSSNVSPHHTAALFCNDLGEQLCSYSTYCPSGKFGDPYNGGPDGLFSMAMEEWEQWAPVNTHGQGTEWVQVGKIVDADGEYGGRCRTYDEWSGGQGVEYNVAPEHRMYILCCNESNI
jgi:hypothetical protein